MRFQVRDGNILLAIFYYDGVLAKRQIKSIFWPNKTSRAMEQRLTKLFRSGYIDWPSREQRKTKPIPEPICWLGWRGALNIAGEHGVKVKQPRSENENQLRIFQNRLRKHGIRWVREPRWSLLGHDVAVVDFRIMVEKAIMEIPYLTLETWIPESEFHSNTDVVSYEVVDG